MKRKYHLVKKFLTEIFIVSSISVNILETFFSYFVNPVGMAQSQKRSLQYLHSKNYITVKEAY